jgi:glycolate oxidase subunit GlcD
MALNADLLVELRRVLAADEIIFDGDDLTRFGRDETEDLCFPPQIVVRPRRGEDVATVLGLAYQHGVPVTPRGGGTGLSAGALPVQGGVVLSLDRLDRILEIDEENLVVVVEPGVVTQTLQEEVERRGLYYPPDPASRGSCTIGGNLAENAGGPHAVKYGVTSDYVMGLRVVLADGTPIRVGGRCRKDVAGYDLKRLLVGSEGTLGVVTEATLRLIPLPEHRALFLAGFATLQGGLDGVLAVLREMTPSACEFLERAAIEAAASHLSRPVPLPGVESYVLMEVDGLSEGDVEAQMLAAGEVLDRTGAVEVVAAVSSREQEELWGLRRAAGEAVKALSTYKEEDCAVPRSRIVDLVLGVKEIAARHGITTICYGHAGDGNIHVNVLRMNVDEETWSKKLPQAIEQIFRLTVSLGGSITGEHGVGFTQRRYLPIQLGSAELDLLRRIKEAFDPRGSLNPGKVLPDPRDEGRGAKPRRTR